MQSTDHPILNVEFLTKEIGPYVTSNPYTGAPRLIEGLNAVWDAINELGGASKVAMMFDVDVLEVEEWIDDHFIPIRIGAAILRKLNMQIEDLYEPSTGYQDEDHGIYWPIGWNPDYV